MGWFVIVVAIVCLCFGYHTGRKAAHIEVALECKRLGGFFVGKTVFKCIEVIEPEKVEIEVEVKEEINDK